MGDLNCYINLKNSEEEKEHAMFFFLNLIDVSSTQMHVMEPIRGSNIFDLVITSGENNLMTENVSVREHFSTSNYQVVIVGIISDVQPGRQSVG